MRILQGTTPTIELKIDTSDFDVDDVTVLEMTLKNGATMLTKALADVTVDAVDNKITYPMTQAETLALNPSAMLYVQCRFKFSDGSIVGTEQIGFDVSKLNSTATI